RCTCRASRQTCPRTPEASSGPTATTSSRCKAWFCPWRAPMSRDVPQGVLPDEVAECIGERHIAAAVFVTFQLEPGFFEDAVLGALFDCDSGRGDRVQRALLEDRLRESEVVVFYDRAGLHVDRTPRQGISLVPVTWGHHVLHAKHALLLLEREGDVP